MKRFGKLLLTLYRRYVDMTVMPGFVFGKIRITLSVRSQAFDIYLLNRHGSGSLESLTFLEHLSVLGDIRTAGENDICRGFAYS